MFKFKVLIVEDDEAVAQSTAAKLRACDLDVRIITRGDEAIPAMKEWQPHAVVLDLHLPGRTGVEIAQEMRIDPILNEIIVITNSSYMDPKESLGASYYGYYVYSKQQEPIMIDKLKPRKGFRNDLTAAVGVTLGEKFHVITPKMQEYLDKLEIESDEDGVA